jgi:hypothetical protein
LLTNLWRVRNVNYILSDGSILEKLRQNQRASSSIGIAALCYRGDGWGGIMKSSSAIQAQPEEFFVVRIDGHVNSSYRRFVDALKAGLRLRDQFPSRDIKVRAIAKGVGALDEMQAIAAH